MNKNSYEFDYPIEKIYNELYKDLNKFPFDVDEIFDKSVYGKANSIKILMLNGYLQEINSSISAESFESELIRWLSSESLRYDKSIKNFIAEKLIYLNASYLDSEGKRNKGWLLRTRDKFQNELKKIENVIRKFPELQLSKNGISEQKKKHRFMLRVSGKGKNPSFLLLETMIIYSIKEFTGYTFENVCLLIAKAYEFFNFLPPKTNPINYSFSLKTNMYQFFNRKRTHIYKLLDIDKGLFQEDYHNHKKEVDKLIDWMQSIIK